MTSLGCPNQTGASAVLQLVTKAGKFQWIIIGGKFLLFETQFWYPWHQYHQSPSIPPFSSFFSMHSPYVWHTSCDISSSAWPGPPESADALVPPNVGSCYSRTPRMCWVRPEPEIIGGSSPTDLEEMEDLAQTVRLYAKISLRFDPKWDVWDCVNIDIRFH